MYALAPRLDIDPWAAFGVGFFAVGTVCSFWLASHASFRRELIYLKELRDAGLIPEAMYQRMTDRAIAWFGIRRYGGGLKSNKMADVGTSPPSSAEPPV